PIPNSDVIIHPGDCNKKIDSILEEIENYKRPSILLFADPEGITEIKWTTISKILSKKIVDIIYILSTGGFKRAVTEEHLEKHFPSLSEEEKLKILSRKCSSEELVKIFVKSILKEVKRYRIFYESLPIYNEKNTEVYRIVWASCSQGAANALERTFELIKKTSNEDILQTIQVILGKQEKLRIT
ncbi:MAG: three-Cys-motif partner protein TcmP, partial [Nitrososphaerota archaeon]